MIHVDTGSWNDLLDIEQQRMTYTYRVIPMDLRMVQWNTYSITYDLCSDVASCGNLFHGCIVTAAPWTQMDIKSFLVNNYKPSNNI